MKKILLTLGVLAVAFSSWAQTRTISGTVTSTEDGGPLPGVNVVLKGTTTGATTDANGKYTLEIPATGGSLLFSFIGLQTREIEVGDRSVVDVSLSLDVTQLGEIVVTGVAVGTSVKKLGFSIGKVGSEQLQEVPATDAGNALRGKVAGIQVVQGTGRPGTAPTIRLRGVTAISGSSQPLIIVDGVITNGSLADINMNDVESIEVLKGAAGSSLYGSLAGNGVIQIITKRGLSDEGGTRVTVRNEFGSSNLAREVPLSYHHFYQLDGSGQFILNTPGNPNTRVAEADFIMDNPYPQTYNNQRLLFKPKPYMTNYASLATSNARTNVFASFENLDQGGVVVDQSSFKRQNLRFNADHQHNDKLKFSVSTLFASSYSPDNGENGQGGLFYPILGHEPDQDLYGTRDTGVLPRTQSNLQNPLYEVRNLFYDRRRTRILNNFQTSYKILDWWRVEGQHSMDNQWNTNTFYQKRGYRTQTGPVEGSPGNMNETWTKSSADVSTLSSYFTKKFGDFNTLVTLRYQFERYKYQSLGAAGSNFVLGDIIAFEAVDPTTFSVNNYQDEIRAENLFFNLGLDYKDKYIFEGLVRRDGSSLFGADERYQIFYRMTGAYRITEDFTIPQVQELKLRASYGISGARPPFNAQYEYYSLSRGGNTAASLVGNRNLKPSKIGEFEIGINANFLDRFNLEVNYANIIADDQILAVPLPSISPYPRQYRNAGTVETKSFEFSLGATIAERADFSWSANIVGSRNVSTVTNLEVPTILRGDGITDGMFRIAEGEEFGIMYGNIFAKSLSDLMLDENGDVVNIATYAPGAATNLQLDDFEVNSDGYVIRTGTAGTPTESATILYDPQTRQKLDTKIGNSRPDLILGLSNNITYKNFSLYLLFDAQLGGDIYNSSKQNLYFQQRHGDLDQSGKSDEQKKAANYYSSATSLYNGAAPSIHFVEDATYLKVRELSVGYKLGRDVLANSAVGKVLHDAKISFVGRNLLTFTNYTGFDPEVASLSAGDPTTFRSDAYVYPMFRTYAVSLELRF